MDKQDPLDHSLLLGDLVPKMPFTYIKIQPFTKLDSKVMIIPMSMLAFQIFWNWFLTSNQQTLHESHRNVKSVCISFSSEQLLDETSYLFTLSKHIHWMFHFHSTKILRCFLAWHKSSRTQSLGECIKICLKNQWQMPIIIIIILLLLLIIIIMLILIVILLLLFWMNKFGGGNNRKCLGKLAGIFIAASCFWSSGNVLGMLAAKTMPKYYPIVNM